MLRRLITDLGKICPILFLLSNAALAAAKGDLIVNIDNPEFRRLVTAIPDFDVSPTADDRQKLEAKTGAAELARLLEFSGLFNFMAQSGYDGLTKAMKAKEGTAGSEGVSGVDLPQWKGLGIESLTLGRISKDAEGTVLEMRTIDINKGTLVLGKRFTKITNINKVIQRYADLLLEAYTGKPGIFSTKLTFVGRTNPKAAKQIYISDFDGSHAIAVTKDDCPHLSPSWSPDGKSIVFTSFKSGNPDLYTYNSVTGKTTSIAAYKGLNSGGAFSPDGKLIAMTGSESGDADIYITTPTGSARQAFIRGSALDVDPTFSPNGKWLAFVSGRFGNPHIFRGDLEWNKEKSSVKVGADKRLTYAGWYNATPAWAPDSEKIAFGGYDREIDRWDLFMMNPDGSKLERLTLQTGDSESPSWSPNGQLIVFQSNRIGTRNVKGPAQALYIMNRDGSGQKKLETGLYEAQTPDWSPVIAD
jgi:TolB protein